jgi:hypothetical protein
MAKLRYLDGEDERPYHWKHKEVQEKRKERLTNQKRSGKKVVKPKAAPRSEVVDSDSVSLLHPSRNMC